MAVFCFNKTDYNSNFIVSEPIGGVTIDNADFFIHFSNNPVINDNNQFIDFSQFVIWNNLIDVIQKIQNNIICIAFNKNTSELFCSSSRFTRKRIFYIEENESIYIGTCLKYLIPYSNKKANLTAMYSVIKFGETPEFITVVDNIKVVPVSCYFKTKINELFKQELKLLFNQYYKINYSFSEISIKNTEQKLENILQYISNNKIMVPLSGGVDSTLINCIIDKFKDEKYPAYFIQFGKNDPEQTFAKMAAENTKADLNICTMESTDFIEAIEYQSNHLDSPIGETSTIPLSYFFKQNNYSGYTILDGTLADGCYGSTNYNKNLFEGIKNRSHISQVMNEQIAGFLQKNNLIGKNLFHPRDAQIKDEYLKFMNAYIGSLSNVYFPKSKKYNKTLEPLWLWYYNLMNIENLNPTDAEWAKYTILKMIGYASRITTAKVEDLCGNNNIEYPFIWKEILDDQAKYSWKDKTQNNIIKFPLKEILSNYKSKDFIFRKKVGLNNAVPQWALENLNKKYLLDILIKNNTIIEDLIGKNNLSILVKNFKSNNIHPNVVNLVISLCSLQKWCDANFVR